MPGHRDTRSASSPPPTPSPASTPSPELTPPYSTHLRAVVTGASRGIGRALTLALAARGAEVVAIARSREALEAVAASHDGRVVPEVLDVSDGARVVERLRAMDRERPVDLVIANAGAGAREGASPWAWEAVEEAFHTNFCGAAATLTALTDGMVARGRGHLVAVGSISSLGALPDAAAYCTPKAGLRMLAACLAVDLAPRGVKVTMVNLGFVRTAMVAGSSHPLPGMMEPEDAATAILRAVDAGHREVDVPRWLGAVARGAGALPGALREALMASVARLR